MLGKLRTRLADETFRAGLLLRSWHKAGLLPPLAELAQCLKDDESKKRKRDNTEAGPSKRPRTNEGSGSSHSDAIEVSECG
jgi:hypothetical protein